MKKGLVKLLVYSISTLILSIIILLSSNNVYAANYTCDDGSSSTECVCGHTPNSTLGYGQVIIGLNTFSCSNVADSICPEDFTDGFTNGNCTSCSDPDCSGVPIIPSIPPSYVSGYVRDKDGSPIPQAIVTGSPIQWDENSDNLERSATTNAAGYYSSNQFITGTYYFSAAKDGYDTQLIETTVTRGQNTSLNFTLQDGTCHEDCTNSYNRCNAACDGVTFANGESCTFYNGPLALANEVKLLCGNVEKGTSVKLSTGGDATHAYFVDCCEGSPELKPYAKAEGSSSGLKDRDVIITEKISKYNNRIVRVRIISWK